MRHYARRRSASGMACGGRCFQPAYSDEVGRPFRLKPAGDTDDPGHLFRRCSHVDVVIRSVGRFGVKLVTFGFGFSEALALEREPVSVVYQAIENGIGQGRVTDDLMPMFDRKLAGHHG